MRVVPNLYPAFERQEVVIHLPRHVRSLVELSEAELELVADAWRRRSSTAAAAGFPYVHAFVNDGPTAGASLPHSHSQLVWLREPPPALAAEGAAAGDCRLCTLLAAERADGVRLVGERSGLVVLCPAAGRLPYEALIAPAEHDRDGFGPRLGEALVLLVELMRTLQSLEGHIAWNAWLHLGEHWHLEVVPRLSTFAGVELGTGIHVLTVAPEDAAAALRDRLP